MSHIPAGLRAFPVIRTRRVSPVVAFYEQLGFTQHTRHPAEGEPRFVGLRRGTAEIAVAHETSLPEEAAPGKGHSPRCEMFVFVEAVDTAVAALRGQGVPVLREPTDMPWGERVAHIADPDGNSVAITSSITPG